MSLNYNLTFESIRMKSYGHITSEVAGSSETNISVISVSGSTNQLECTGAQMSHNSESRYQFCFTFHPLYFPQLPTESKNKKLSQEKRSSRVYDIFHSLGPRHSSPPIQATKSLIR